MKQLFTMRVERFLLLLLTPWPVSGILNSELNKNESKTKSEVLRNSHNGSRGDYLNKEPIGLNGTLHWDDVVGVWNPSLMAKLWKNVPSESLNISMKCEKDIADYTVALAVGEQWALKMIDATGKYTWGLLSGNVYWVGSIDQCREMETQFVEWRKENVQRRTHVPPFLVSMNSVTLDLNIRHHELNKTYQIVLGLCLPNSCAPKDIEELLYFVRDKHGNKLSAEIAIQNVRSFDNKFSLWNDHLFRILFVTCIAVILLVILGTLCDIALRYRILRTIEKDERNENASTEMKILNARKNVNEKITIAKLWSVKEHNTSLDVNSSSNVPRPLSEALLSFSLLVNLSKIFSSEVGGDTLAPIHGLKFLSMMWIVLLHTCMYIIVPADCKTFRSNVEKSFFFQTISNGTYAVDTFFFTSGCLVSFLYFRTIAKDKMQKVKVIKGSCGQVMQFLGMLWYRYFRLTPPYLLAIVVSSLTMKWYYYNRVFDWYTYDRQTCRKFWWRNILYINTYFPLDERCMIWSWYLANDTQFYVVGIIILIIAARYIPLAMFLTIFLLIGSWITTATITLKTQHVPSAQDPFAHYESLYDKPWMRIGPYLLGMIVGWYLYKSNCKLNIHKTAALLSWILSFVTMLSIVYGLYGNTFGPFMSAAYTALSHSGWAISVAWILIACVTGHGGIVNKILSCKCFYPLSRLTYCAYLVHPTIMRAVITDIESPLHLSQQFVCIMFLGYLVATYIAALFISLLFEAPMVSLLRIFHPLRQWKIAKALSWSRRSASA